MNTYEQDCENLDKELAELIYGQRVIIDSYTDCMWFSDDMNFCQPALERWTQDNHSAFGLMAEYDISVCTWKHHVDAESTSANYSNFPDKQAAVRFAVCQAVVKKLKGI
jgi:hypothetical protein